jgi:hypothetical protein
LTPEGRLLVNRAAEIVGRVDAATNELAAQVGLQAGRVRLAANASALSTIVPKAAATLAQAYPGIELSLIDRHPVEALQMLRHGEVCQPRQQAALRPAAANGLGAQRRPVEHRQTDDAVTRGAAIAKCRYRRRDADPLH